MSQPQNALLCTDLSIWPNFGNPVLVSDAIYASKVLKASLANRLLLYDRLVIPTGNYLVLPVLRLWLGDRAVNRLLREDIVALARYDSWFGYIGNGGGLKFYKIGLGDTPESREHNIGTVTFAPIEEAIDKILEVGNPKLSDFEKPALRKLLLDKSIPIQISQYEEQLRRETYTDILKSSTLRSFFAIRNRHLDHLHGIKPNEVVTANFHERRLGLDDKPEIGAVFKIALENLLLTLAADLNCSIQGDLDSKAVLKAKGQRIGLADAQLEGFLSISDLHGLPDVGHLFAADELSFDALMEIREHRTTTDLRTWLNTLDPLGRDDVVRAYVSGLRQKTPVESLPAKALRFIGTTALGAIPGIGAVAGALGGFADSFLIQKLFPGKLPGILLDGFRTVVVQAADKHPVRRIKGSQRNEPCPCGSGRKSKRCCGTV